MAKRTSKRRKVAFQGEPGANSDLACREAYPAYEPLPCPTFEDAFAAVRSGTATLAMIPIENSVAGRVADIHHLMPHRGLHIVGRMVPSGAASADGAEGRDAEDDPDRSRATSTRSASAAMSSASSAIKAVVAADTAGAAREVAEAGDVTRAALATALAAKIYGLQILKKDVADARHNTTRFIVLSRKPKWASRNERRVITTFVFEVRNIPAALYKALGGFATNGVNMTKLESYMVERQFRRHPVLRRRAGPSEGPRTRARARGAGIRLAAEIAADSRRLPGAPFSRNLQVAGKLGKRLPRARGSKRGQRR